jgi:hypothetical protein
MKQLIKTGIILMIFFFPIGKNPGGAFAQSQYPGQHEDKLTVKETALVKAYAFNMVM